MASMGPRSIDRGTKRKCDCIGLTTWLQWGRDQLIAELFWAAIICGPLPALQWGRDQLIAELPAAGEAGHLSRASMGPRSIDRGTDLRRHPRHQHAVASMGPRSIDRGTSPDLARPSCNRSLQWGRDQLIAELPSFATLPNAGMTLQWGRDQLIAELEIGQFQVANPRGDPAL